MSVQVYGCNHVAIEVGDIGQAVAFYEDVFGLEKLDDGEGEAFFKLGEHQFLAMFERKDMKPDTSDRHFGIMVRDDAQLAEVRAQLTAKYGLQLIAGFRCDFRDPWGSRGASTRPTPRWPSARKAASTPDRKSSPAVPRLASPRRDTTPADRSTRSPAGREM
jgi:catechol 2,3-dioxygenase-like lactoylglutathione lyase family enzyme